MRYSTMDIASKIVAMVCDGAPVEEIMEVSNHADWIVPMINDGATKEDVADLLEACAHADWDAEVALEHDDSEWADRQHA